MQKAKDLLTLQLEMTNKEIAAAVGFKDQSHFIATFHKQTGMTPNQFRKLYES
ncbi:helix-turn-helix domain-containing protein [Paenibacillus aquistagni]|nr:AraC family transcriptional regulator [Paenibacillus aquistagni]